MSNDFNTRFDFFIGLTSQSGNQLDVHDVIQDHVVPNLAAQGIDGFTITRTEGYWKGQREHSIVVTVFDHVYPTSTATWPTEVAERLARELDQETILVSSTPCTANLI